MSNLYGTRKYAIEGENARKVYEAVSGSMYYRKFPEYLKLDYKDGLLLVVEEWDNYPQFGDYVLPFLIGEDYYWMDMTGYSDNGPTTNDVEGKYFKIQ